MRSIRSTLAAAAIALCAAGAALAGPFAEYEADARIAYAAYRSALFRSNTDDQKGSVAAITRFSAEWGKLAGKWSKTTPPQYADDKAFIGELKSVGDLSGKALAQAKAGDLKAAHLTLEAIRDILATQRKRNGLVAYSDHVNAYHSHMETMLKAAYANDRTRLIADTGVLTYLAGQLKAHAPEDYAKKPEFGEALSALEASVTAIQKAMDKGDMAAAVQAVKLLKKPYAMFFVRWG
ncbi:MAG: hypothetical protein AB7F96_06515 [Beijerinckiaceae bacterium]